MAYDALGQMAPDVDWYQKTGPRSADARYSNAMGSLGNLNQMQQLGLGVNPDSMQFMMLKARNAAGAAARRAYGGRNANPDMSRRDWRTGMTGAVQGARNAVLPIESMTPEAMANTTSQQRVNQALGGQAFSDFTSGTAPAWQNTSRGLMRTAPTVEQEKPLFLGGGNYHAPGGQLQPDPYAYSDFPGQTGGEMPYGGPTVGGGLPPGYVEPIPDPYGGPKVKPGHARPWEMNPQTGPYMPASIPQGIGMRGVKDMYGGELPWNRSATGSWNSAYGGNDSAARKAWMAQYMPQVRSPNQQQGIGPTIGPAAPYPETYAQPYDGWGVVHSPLQPSSAPGPQSSAYNYANNPTTQPGVQPYW